MLLPPPNERTLVEFGNDKGESFVKITPQGEVEILIDDPLPVINKMLDKLVAAGNISPASGMVVQLARIVVMKDLELRELRTNK